LSRIFHIATWVATLAALLAMLASYSAWQVLQSVEQELASFRQSCICTVAHPIIGEPLASSEWVCEREAAECARVEVMPKFERFDREWPEAQDVLVSRVQLFSLAFSAAALLWLLRLLLFVRAKLRKPA